MQIKLRILFPLLALFPATLASFSVNSIEPLSESNVSPGCLKTYNSPISSCDFSQISSHTCTYTCQQALQNYAKDVILACRQALVEPHTLLKSIIDGRIVTTLCGESQLQPQQEEKGAVKTPITTANSYTSTTIGTGILTVNIPAATGDGALTSLEIDTRPTPTVSKKIYSYDYSGPTAVTTGGSGRSTGYAVSASGTSENGTVGNSTGEAPRSGVPRLLGVGIASIVIFVLAI